MHPKLLKRTYLIEVIMMTSQTNLDLHLWYLDSSNKWHLRFKVKNVDEDNPDLSALEWAGNYKKN